MSILRKLKRKFFSLIPPRTRGKVIRSFVNIQPLPPHVEVKIARTQSELEQAFALLHDCYVKLGYMDPHPSGMRITPYHALPSTTTLIVEKNGEVIATLSIVRRSTFGFPLERIFDIDFLKINGVRLAEISGLAIAPQYRHNGGQYLFPLLKYMYEYCLNYFGVDVLLIAVNPNQIDFYEHLLFFNRIQEKTVDNYSFVNGAPAVGGYLNLRKAYTDFANHYAGKKENQDLFNYFRSKPSPAFVFPEREFHQISDPIMTPQLLDHFFNKKTDIFARMEEPERGRIARLYNHKKYREVFPENEWDREITRTDRQKRFDVNCEGRICLSKNIIISIKVLNVSHEGLCAIVPRKLRYGETLFANVAVGQWEIADLKVFPVWNKDEQYGFKVDESSENWKKFIAHLNSTLLHESDGEAAA